MTLRRVEYFSRFVQPVFSLKKMPRKIVRSLGRLEASATSERLIITYERILAHFSRLPVLLV